MKKIKIVLVALLVLLQISCVQKEQSVITDFSPPEWSYNKAIYELNIRQFTKEGSFAALEKHLQEIKDMGIGIIWLMPIHPIGVENRKGSLGSYYSVKDYKDVNPNFGTKKDFKRLVDKIHSLDMYVIIDWVANHTSWDHEWTKTNKDFYNLDSSGNFMPPVKDWSDVIDLNYENKALWAEMIDALEYWVDEFDIDGYRCDVASMVPNAFWKEARSKLENIKPVFMLAEAHEPELHKNGFNMTYNWKLKDLMNNYASGSIALDDFKQTYLKNENSYPENAFRMNFTTNHDENSWNGTVYERLGNLAEPFSVLISTIYGMPLVYSGQEAGMDKRLMFFEKDPIVWKDHKQRSIFSTIFKEKKINKALWNGTKGGKVNFINVSENDGVLAFYREKDNNKIIVVLNLSKSNAVLKFDEQKLYGNYKNLFLDDEINLNNKFTFDLESTEYLVLVN